MNAFRESEKNCTRKKKEKKERESPRINNKMLYWKGGMKTEKNFPTKESAKRLMREHLCHRHDEVGSIKTEEIGF